MIRRGLAMLPCLAVVSAALAATPSSVERNGARIEVSVKAQVFSWSVTNIDAHPITSFEVRQHNCYDHRVPEGWTVETDQDWLHAWTEDESRAIHPGQSRDFSARASSSGAVLGSVPATVGTAGAGRQIHFDAVWGPVRRSRSLVVIVALTLTGIAAVHGAVAVSRR